MTEKQAEIAKDKGTKALSDILKKAFGTKEVLVYVAHGRGGKSDVLSSALRINGSWGAHDFTSAVADLLRGVAKAYGADEHIPLVLPEIGVPTKGKAKVAKPTSKAKAGYPVNETVLKYAKK